jgi:hypothetical protein
VRWLSRLPHRLVGVACCWSSFFVLAGRAFFSFLSFEEERKEKNQKKRKKTFYFRRR